MEIVWRGLCICYQMCHLSLLARYSFDQGRSKRFEQELVFGKFEEGPSPC